MRGMNLKNRVVGTMGGASWHNAARACICPLLAVLTGCTTPGILPQRPNKPLQVQSPVNLPAGIYPYPQNGVFVGQGWDTFNNGGTAGSCVKVDAIRLERSSYGMDVQQILSSYSLLRTVESSVSAAYRGGGGSVKATASTSSSRQVKTDDQNFLFNFESWDGSTFAVAPGSVRNSVAANEATLKLLSSSDVNERVVQLMLNEPVQFGGSTMRLTDEAIRLLHQPEDFRRLCGEGFVAAIHRGVRIQVLLSQSGASLEEKNSLTASLSASGYGASGRASYSQSKAEMNTTDKLGYRVFQEGGIPVQPQAISLTNKRLNVNEILPKADQLLANPTAFRVVVVPYANIDPRVGEKLPTPLQLMTIGDYYIALNDVYALVRDMAASAKLDPVQGSVSWSGISPTLIAAYGGMPHLERLNDEILSDLAFLEGLMAECYKTRRNCTVKDATIAATKEITTEVATQKSALAKYLGADTTDVSALVEIGGEKLKQATVVPATTATARDLVSKAAEQYDELRQLQRLERLQESIVDDEPSLGFFLRFYWYLTQIPPTLTDLNPSMAVPAAAQREARAKEINTAIVNSVMASRIGPWKAFFCENLKSEALCVPDAWLRDLVSQNAVSISPDAISVTPPPPPPRKKKCKWPKCWW